MESSFGLDNIHCDKILSSFSIFMFSIFGENPRDLITGNSRVLCSKYSQPVTPFATWTCAIAFYCNIIEVDWAGTGFSCHCHGLQHSPVDGCLILTQLPFLQSLAWWPVDPGLLAKLPEFLGLLSMFNVLMKFTVSHVRSIEINGWYKDFLGSSGGKIRTTVTMLTLITHHVSSTNYMYWFLESSIILWGINCYCAHFTDMETKA